MADEDLFSSSRVALGLHSLDPLASTAYNTQSNTAFGIAAGGVKTKKALPRVTAYCTASKYDMDAVMRWLRSSEMRDGCHVECVRRVDECVWFPYVPPVSIFETLSNRRQARKTRQRDRFNNVTSPTLTGDSPPPTFVPQSQE